MVGMTLLMIGTSFGVIAMPQESENITDEGSPIRIQIKPLPEDISKIYLVTAPTGRRQFEMVHIDGSVERLSSEAFAERLYANQA